MSSRKPPRMPPQSGARPRRENIGDRPHDVPQDASKNTDSQLSRGRRFGSTTPHAFGRSVLRSRTSSPQEVSPACVVFRVVTAWRPLIGTATPALLPVSRDAIG
jgi:hypothetical protein